MRDLEVWIYRTARRGDVRKKKEVMDRRDFDYSIGSSCRILELS